MPLELVLFDDARRESAETRSPLLKTGEATRYLIACARPHVEPKQEQHSPSNTSGSRSVLSGADYLRFAGGAG